MSTLAPRMKGSFPRRHNGRQMRRMPYIQQSTHKSRLCKGQVLWNKSNCTKLTSRFDPEQFVSHKGLGHLQREMTHYFLFVYSVCLFVVFRLIRPINDYAVCAKKLTQKPPFDAIFLSLVPSQLLSRRCYYVFSFSGNSFMITLSNLHLKSRWNLALMCMSTCTLKNWRGGKTNWKNTATNKRGLNCRSHN